MRRKLQHTTNRMVVVYLFECCSTFWWLVNTLSMVVYYVFLKEGGDGCTACWINDDSDSDEECAYDKAHAADIPVGGGQRWKMDSPFLKRYVRVCVRDVVVDSRIRCLLVCCTSLFDIGDIIVVARCSFVCLKVVLESLMNCVCVSQFKGFPTSRDVKLTLS